MFCLPVQDVYKAQNSKSEARNPKQILIFECSKQRVINWVSSRLRRSFGHWDSGHLVLPFDLAQGGGSFDLTQDREALERPLQPFRNSDFDLPARLFVVSSSKRPDLASWRRLTRSCQSRQGRRVFGFRSSGKLFSSPVLGSLSYCHSCWWSTIFLEDSHHAESFDRMCAQL
jgi:hypothetical protein